MSVDQIPNVFSPLKAYKNANLTTFRRNGEGVITTIWFVLFEDKLYLRTQSNAGKVKRIRKNAHVQLAPSTARGKVLGPIIEANAHFLTPGSMEEQHAKTLLDRRYRIELLIALPFRWFITRRGTTTYFQIEPYKEE